MNHTEKIIHILKELGGCGTLSPEARLQEDVGLDSLGLVTLLVKLEDTFAIELEESDLNPFDLQTIADVTALVTRYVGGSHETEC